MITKLIPAVLAAGVLAVVVVPIPGIKRYLELRSM